MRHYNLLKISLCSDCQTVIAGSFDSTYECEEGYCLDACDESKKYANAVTIYTATACRNASRRSFYDTVLSNANLLMRFERETDCLEGCLVVISGAYNF